MKTAKELLGFNFDIQAFSKGVPTVRGNTKAMQKLGSICSNHEGVSMPKQSELKQVYRDFILKSQSESPELAEHFDSIRLTRRLSWTLAYSENTPPFNIRIADSPLLHKALSLLEMRFSASMIMGVFEALLQSWTSKYSTLMRRFLKKHLGQYDGKRKLLLNLKKNQDYFCEENGTTQLALRLIREKIPLANVWDHLALLDHTRSYSYFGNVAIAYVALAKRTGLNRATLEDLVAFLEIHNSDATLGDIVSIVIEHLGDDASENLREPIETYILNNRKMGDPRIAGGHVWSGVSENAKKIFTRWLTRKDLVIFFDAVSRVCNDKQFAYRRAFWMAYLEHISYCRPVLRPEVLQYFANDPQVRQYFYQRRPATLRGGTRDQHAFIIQMANYTFVEFSTSGACRVYSNSSLPFEISRIEYHISRLRNDSRLIEKFNHDHYLNWQGKLANWIKTNMGIEPMRSYKRRWTF